MVSGVLGIIACPMLEDELLHSLLCDSEEKEVWVIDDEHAEAFRGMADRRGLVYRLATRRDFYRDGIPFDRSKFNVVIQFNDLALHKDPKELREKIERQVAEIQPHIDALGLYYGMCGNFGWDVSEWADRQGFKPVCVFRDMNGMVCDDCVGVAIGGGRRYTDLTKRYTGMLYLTPAIASNWEVFTGAMDGMGDIEQMDPSVKEYFGITDSKSYIRWMMSIAGYEYGLKIDTGLEESEERYEADCASALKQLNLKPLDIEEGWVTLQPADDIYAECKRNLAGKGPIPPADMGGRHSAGSHQRTF